MAKTVRLKCARCARAPGPNEDGLMLCKCKGRRYCNKACRKADEKTHAPDCNTIEILAKPGNMARAVDMIKLRDRSSSEAAKQENVVFHLILVIREPRRQKQARYIGPFLEFDSLEQKIQETVRDFDSVIPSAAFLSELLNSPVGGLAGVEEVRIPLAGLQNIIYLQVPFEKRPYIKYCYRNTLWSLRKLLYVVVIDIPRSQMTRHEKEDRYVSKVEVFGTFGSLLAANACVSALVERWNKEKGYEATPIPVKPNSVQGVQTSRRKGTEMKRVRIVTRTLLQAGATKGTDGETTAIRPQGRNDFAKRIRVVEHTD
ncbi:hypothetical protein N0V90_004552 [Kalmusia sp. IMI 367209]|nr:hypothetical protein N0V90_004552 [Kalmusia sp. IMI 367209]